jgi:putative transposase
MNRKRFTEEQIIAVLHEHEAGAKATDLARKHGVSEATLYNWKAKYGGLDVSEARRLKAFVPRSSSSNDLPGEAVLIAPVSMRLPCYQILQGNERFSELSLKSLCRKSLCCSV